MLQLNDTFGGAGNWLANTAQRCEHHLAASALAQKGSNAALVLT
jgi:hypothetical protein